MVTPLVLTVAPASANPGATAYERPPATPEPARQITPTEQTRGGNTPTDAGAVPIPASSLEQALAHLNGAMKAWATCMRFDVDSDSGRLVISIIDNETGDVLRTVPTDAVIRAAKMIAQLQGKSIDTRV